MGIDFGHPRCKYSDELANEICQRIAAGELLKDICKDKDVDITTVYAWRQSHPELDRAYLHARKMQAQLFAEQLLSIKTETQDDVLSGDKGPIINSASVQRHKLHSDNVKWFLQVGYPHLYGDGKKQEKIKIDSSTKPTELSQKIAELLVNGEITAEHADKLLTAVERHAKLVQLDEMQARLEQLESRVK